MTSQQTQADKNTFIVSGNAIIDCGPCCDSPSIPAAINKIGAYAFAGSNIKNLVVPEGIEEIDSFAFANCPLLKSVKLPKSLKRMGLKVFDGCPNLKSIRFESELDNHGGGSLWDSSIDEIYFSDGIEDIGLICYSLPNLAKVRLPKSLKRIRWLAFALCRSLEEVEIPYQAISEIADNAFKGSPTKIRAMPEDARLATTTERGTNN